MNAGGLTRSKLVSSPQQTTSVHSSRKVRIGAYSGGKVLRPARILIEGEECRQHPGSRVGLDGVGGNFLPDCRACSSRRGVMSSRPETGTLNSFPLWAVALMAKEARPFSNPDPLANPDRGRAL